MAFQSDTSFVPIPPPSEDELPHDDGVIQSERHRKQMDLLIEALDLLWKERDDVYVGGNMAVYSASSRRRRTTFAGRTSSWCSTR
ncbi:hypothetical protein [Sorangium sp. So ce381]|uniref:hypothetical protein n=1 Tax=Sorangium sp. So ce381 TaxID=3133307 RepID=UPI003F5B5609